MLVAKLMKNWEQKDEVPEVMLGGSSSINGMVFTRGQAEDYDHWAQLATKDGVSKILPF